MFEKHLSENIPKPFKSVETGEDFKCCLICDELLETKSRYFIEKIFTQNLKLGSSETLYEYAICEPCLNKMQEELSKESLQSIQNLYRMHGFNIIKKMEHLLASKNYDINSWLKACSFTAKPIMECSEYQITGMVENGLFVFGETPLVVSDDFLALTNEVLSKKTKDFLDGFKDDFFDLSPELKDLIKGPVGVF